MVVKRGLPEELAAKQAEHADMQKSHQELEIPETFLQSVMHDIRMFISMLDEETPNRQTMKEHIRRFISNICIHREMKTVQTTVELKYDEQVLYRYCCRVGMSLKVGVSILIHSMLTFY